MSATNTQAQLFATEYAKDTARELLETLRSTSKHAGRVTGIALGVSMPHQVGFILGLAPLRWGSVTNILESVTLILGAIGIPIAVDFLILICIKVLAARGAERRSKRIAIRVMWFPVVVSGAVNMLAPAPLLIRLLFGVAVVLIPAAEGLRASIRPDFAQIEAMETQIRSQVSAPAGRRSAEEQAEINAKAAETRARKSQEREAQNERRRLARLEREARKAASANYTADDAANEKSEAPVSPAPQGT